MYLSRPRLDSNPRYRSDTWGDFGNDGVRAMLFSRLVKRINSVNYVAGLARFVQHSDPVGDMRNPNEYEVPGRVVTHASLYHMPGMNGCSQTARIMQ